MPPKKGKKANQKKKVEEVKPKETKLTSASKPRGSSRNSIDKIQTPNPPKQEEITAYLKDDNNVKKDQNGKHVEDEEQQQIEQFISPRKDTQQIGQLLFTSKSIQSKLNTPSQKLTSSKQGKVVESKTLFTPSKTQIKSWKVCLSGFSKQTKEFNKNAIIDLNGEYFEQIQPGLDVLVATKAAAIKTKLCYDSGIPIVSSKWLIDSMGEKFFIEDVKKYLLKPFVGCKLNILGFSEDEYQSIKESIMLNGGDCINDLNEAQKESSLHSQIDMTIINSKNNSSSYLNIIKTPAVDEKWLKECLKRHAFIYPRHYIINKKDLNQYNLDNEETIKKRMQEIECSSKDYNYFQDSTFYIHSANLDDKKLKVITHLINLGGGFFANQVLPCTTHIVTPYYTKDDLSEFTQYGNSIFLVHPEFLKESFNVCKRLNEVDYCPQLVDQNQINSQQIYSQEKSKNDSCGIQSVIQTISGLQKNKSSMSNGLNSIFNGQGGNTLSRMNSINGNPFSNINQNQIGLYNISERDEIYSKTDQKSKKLTFKQQKQLVPIKGNLFKNCFFYLEVGQYKNKLKQYKYKIFENQGDILPVIDEKVKEIFHILDDKPENAKIIEKQAPNVTFYSYRWIDFCIEKKQVIRNYQQLFHLSPFLYDMPLKGFEGLSLYCSGYNPNEKLALRETINIIGAKYEFTSGKKCYLIADNKECKKYRYLQQEQEDLTKLEYEKKWGQLHIVGAFWFLECVTQGKLLDLEHKI